MGLASAGPMDSRIAIVNRGEPARRLIHAARELNDERGWAIRTIALHTLEERRATFVREADESLVIGRAGAGNPYIDHAELERALRECRRRRRLGRVGVRRRGPRVRRAVRADRRHLHRPARPRRCGASATRSPPSCSPSEVGVPVAEWSRGPVETDEDALRHAAAIGFPLMIKAAAGGGGRGIRIVSSEAELLPGLERARDEAERAFGDASVLMERLVDRRAPRRGAGDRRPLRHGLGGRRARLLGPAPQPEADRGVGVAGAGRGAGGGAAARRGRPAAGRRVSERRHRRVPLPAGGADADLPRGQHAPPGGAPGDRGGDRPRPGEAADPHRGGRAARG